MSARTTKSAERKLDLAILAGLLLLFGAQWAISRSGRSVWPGQPQAVETRIQKLFSGDAETMRRQILAQPVLQRRFQAASCAASLVLAGSLVFTLRLLFCLFTGRPFYRPLGSPAPPAWGLRQILRLAGLVLLAIHAATLVEWAMARYLRPVWLDRTVIALINTLLSDGIVLAAAAVLLLRAGKYGKGRRSWAAVGFAIAAYLTFLPFLGALVMALTAFFRFIQYEPAPQPVFTIYFSESRLPVIGWLLVLVTVIGPVAEEFFFRGLLYGWLRTRVGILSGLLFSAFIFALLHASWVAFAPIFALGLLFGWVYEQTGTLAAPMAIHVLHNGAMLYGAFLMKTLMRLGSP